ncbi:MAG: hypothetical protein M3680_22745 [Myxococcota bacterium]|nr:hypothetical protein [Myxococcota bacterium]
MMRAIGFVAIVSGLAACSSGTATEDLPPVLEITTPQRGTFSSAAEVTVTGRVTDEGAVRVSVNGTAVTPAADGSFTTTVAVEPGIGLIETHAIDSAGHDVRDVRAVLSGEVAPSDGSVKAAVGARLAPAGLQTVATSIATAAKAIDFTAAAKAMNPVYNNTGCLGARIDITSVTLGNIGATLTPKAGAIDTAVAISNVVVRLNANFRVACISGSTTITVRSSTARVRDDLGVTIAAGKLKTALPSPTVTLEGFQVDVGGVPGAIESLLKDQARSAAEKAIVGALQSRVPAIADAKLADLIAKPLSTTLLGKTLTSTVTPSKIELAATGLFVAVDTTLAVEGGEGGSFAANPMPITASLVGNARTLGVAVADDVVNQLFAGLWAAGSLDAMLPIASVGPIAALLDDDVATLEVKMSLPPTMGTVGSGLELALGDLIITGRDASGAEVQKFAMSLRTTIVAGPTGANKLVLTTTTPIVFAQVLVQSAAVDNPLDASELEGIVAGVWGVVGGMADDALAKLPMPAVAGIQLGAPTVQGDAGYVVLDVGTP